MPGCIHSTPASTLRLDGLVGSCTRFHSRSRTLAGSVMKALPAGSPLRARRAIAGLPRSRFTPTRSNSASSKALTLSQCLSRPDIPAVGELTDHALQPGLVCDLEDLLAA